MHVTCALLAVVVLTTVAMATDDNADSSAAVDALARALEHYRRSAAHLSDQTDADWPAKKREAALDVDYGWGGGRFGKRRMADRLGIAGRFGRSVDGMSRSAPSSSRTKDD